MRLPPAPEPTMTATPPADDSHARKAAIREQARKNRIAQKDKDAVSRQIVGAFVALPAYAAAKTVMWYVDAGSEVRTRHVLPEALRGGARTPRRADGPGEGVLRPAAGPGAAGRPAGGAGVRVPDLPRDPARPARRVHGPRPDRAAGVPGPRAERRADGKRLTDRPPR